MRLLLIVTGILCATLLPVFGCSTGNRLQRTCRQARQHMEKEEWAKAEVAFGKALAIAPTHTDALIGRAAARIRLEQLEPALEDLNAALAIRPDETDWRARRGVLLLGLSRLRESLADLNFVLERVSDHAPALAARAFVHFQLKNFNQARKDADQATKNGIPMDEWVKDWPKPDNGQ